MHENGLQNWPVYMLNMFLCLQVQGLIISQMLRKSVETRDWVNTIEPRNVRAVMKRVVEDTTSIDVQVRFVLCGCPHLRGKLLSLVLYLLSPCVARGSSEKSGLHHRLVCSMKKV